MSQNKEDLTNINELSQITGDFSQSKQHQKSRSSPKLMNQNIKSLINKSNKYLLETNTLLQKTKTIFIQPSIPHYSTNSNSDNQNPENVFDDLSPKDPFKLSFSPQYSFINKMAPSFVTSMPTSNNPSFSNSSLSKFRNFAFVLSLNEKGLTRLTSDMIMNKSNLQILELKNNKLKTVPEEIFLLPNLKCLKMDGNYIKEIPKAMCESLKQIEILSFFDNIINKIPVEIMYMKSTLIYLNLAENHIDFLPKEIGQLVNLNCLHLEHNHFSILPMTMANLINLKEFGLDWFKYTSSNLKVVQNWRSTNDEIASKFFALKKMKVENITLEKFSTQISLKKLDFKQKLPKNRTLIHKAALENDIGVLRALLTILYDDLNNIDCEDQTALFLSIRNENYLASKVLLHNGADPKIGGGVLGSCLNLATAKCQYYLVSDLLKYGADVNKCDIDGNNSLHVLMCLFDSDTVNYKKIAELLLEYGLNPNMQNKHKWGAVHLAIKRGQSEGVKWILEYNEIRKIDNDLNEINSEQGGSLELFNLNIKGGEEKLTALHLAVTHNNIPLVEKLINLGKVDIFARSKNEKLASHLAIQNIFLYKILKSYERNFTQRTLISSLKKEKKLRILGKDINLKSEAEISDDSSEARTFQKVKDLNEVTKDKRVFSQKGHIFSTNALVSSNEQRNFYFNKFNIESNNGIPQRSLPLKQLTKDYSLNDTQISDMEENKSDIEIIYELEDQWGKNMRSFFGSPNNIQQLDALQKVNHLLNMIKPCKNQKAQSLYSKKIAMNHIKVITDSLNSVVENLKKSMKTVQVKILDFNISLSQRVKNLNGILLFHYKMEHLLKVYKEEKLSVDQFRRLMEANPHLNKLKNGERPIFEITQQSSMFFNTTHSSLALRWLIYLFMNLNANDLFDNAVLKFFIIRLFANFYYENASSFLHTLFIDKNEPFFLRYEAYQTLKSFNKSENLLRELPKNAIIITNNSSLKPVSMEISKEISTEKVKNFGSNYFSNKKQMVRNENLSFYKGDNKDNFVSQNMITVNSSEVEDQEEKESKTLLDELQQEQTNNKKMNFKRVFKKDYEEKYNIEGFREKENKGKG